MSHTLHLRLPRAQQGLDEAREAMDTYAQAMEFDRKAVTQVQIVLDEVLSNVLRHGDTRNIGPYESEIDITMTLLLGKLTVEIAEHSAQFDPTISPYDNEATRPRHGGRGLDLVRRLSDTLSYDWRDGKNHLTFTKRVRPISKEIELMGKGLSLSESQDNGVATVALTGRIDSGNANDLTEHLVALTQAGCKTIVIDFSKLEYLTSAGFRTLLIASDAAEDVGGELRLRNLTDNVQELFELSGLIDAFTVEGAVI